MIVTSRRTLITGLVALVAAPAIVKVASLMPVNAALQPGDVSMRLLASYDPGLGSTQSYVIYSSKQLFVAGLCRCQEIGDTLRIRLPNDFIVADGPTPDFVFDPARMYSFNHKPEVEFPASTPLALAAAAVAVAPVILEKPVTRRFWSK